VCAKCQLLNSLDLNTGSESHVVIEVGSEFQTDGAGHRKARKGLTSSGTSDERNVRACVD